LTLGGRYTDETHRIIDARSTIHNADETDTTLLDFPTGQDGTSSHSMAVFKPKVSLELHPFEDDTLFYLSYQQAFKSGTYNALNIYMPPNYVLPEEMTAYESGIKTSLFDGTTRFAAAAFYYDIQNIQVQYISVFKGGIVSFENAGGARVKGLEFETVSEIFQAPLMGWC